MGGITLQGVNWSVMLALISTEAHVDFNFILLLGCLHEGALLCADQVLEGGCI